MAVLADRMREKHKGDAAQATAYRDLAVRYYSKIIREAASSGKGYAAQVALARLGAPVPEIRIYQVATTPTAPATQPSASTSSERGDR
jgi:hypothetical protein